MPERYKGLEEQIVELWESRGWEVLEETAVAISGGRFRWTIIARPKEVKEGA